MLRALIFTLTALLTPLEAADGEPIVHLQQGKIRGTTSLNDNGRIFYSFKTIPFAMPPVGDLRFRDSLPHEGWGEEVRDGSLPTPICPQLNVRSFLAGIIEVVGQEDCLFLSVYTPQLKSSNLPVMVYIHWGAFTLGGAERFSPLPLLNRDIVLVVIQYRLATLGFLSTEDSELPGNMGLKDQTLALRWVRDNIRHFGGDAEKVTIVGSSAGGASVHFHVLSPMSKGLFKRAIMQSGTSLCPWALREGHREVVIKLAHLFNCSSVHSSLDSKKVLTCLREISVEKLISVQLAFSIWTLRPSVMIPRVDGEFLPEHPAVLLREGRYNKVDIIAGLVRNEGGMRATTILRNPELVKSLVQNFSINGPVSLDIESLEDDPEYLARRAFHYYLGPIEHVEEKKESFMQLLTDNFFTMAHLDAVHFHERDAAFGNHIYAYRLQHVGENSFMEITLRIPPLDNTKWIIHSDDELYFFDSFLRNHTMSRSDDLFVRRLFLDLWVNFAYTGNPTPDLSLGFTWKPVSEAQDSFLSITSSPHMKRLENQETQEFWRNAPTKKNKLLFPERFEKCRKN